MPTPEGVLQAQILDYLVRRMDAHRDIFVWRENVGTAVMRGKFTKFGRKGCSDIIGLRIRWAGGEFVGQFLGIEIKAGAARQTADQREFQRHVEALGGRYVLARSLADVQRALGPPQPLPLQF